MEDPLGNTRARNPSLWIGTTEAREHAPLAGDLQVDVAVLGAGIAGLTAARMLAGTGMTIAVVEAGELCAGVTGYTTAKVTSLHSAIYTRVVDTWGSERAAVYATANEAAIAKVRELASVDGIGCDLEAASAYTYTENVDGVAAIEREAEAARRAGLDATVTTDTDLPYAVRAAVRLDNQAQFHPRKYCLGLADAIVRAGGTVFERTRATTVDDGRVTTDRGVITADAIVLATHIPISDAGGHFARMEPKRSYAGAFRADERPRGMYISIDEPTRSVRSTRDGWVIVGGEGHKVGQDDDTTRRYTALEAWARERFRSPALEYRWSAQDYESADGLPFIGRLSPGSDRLFVATGFGKWGMTNGTVAGMIIADLVQGVKNAWAETFDATRIPVKQSARGVLRENIDVVKHFVGDRIADLDPPDVATIAPGTGAIASRDGAKVAAFRDDDGRLLCVSPTCTHLGCQVAFNTAERTWDCPCHGSRFDVDGRVIQGPAVEDLAPRDSS
jgi:glycine/D-amino acid oxidase-like deaminating enzyme/nitrite reductase/ring-hydroxylating ferredoxin subunit